MHKLLSIPFIVGQTASGKSAAGIALARKLNGEILSADSRQIYKYLSEGTSKPPGQWVTHKNGRHFIYLGITHHLMDFLDPEQTFSAGDFVQRACHALKDIYQRGKTPIIVGGTGLYIRSLIKGIAPLPEKNMRIRQKLSNLAERKGRDWLHQKLSQIDPESAQNIPPQNIQRLIRAMEVYELTGKPISFWHKQTKPAVNADFRLFGILWRKEHLHRRITLRCKRILPRILKETRQLLKKGYSPHCPGLQSLGYREGIATVQKKMTEQELLDQLIHQTVSYAKRQMTWFRKEEGIHWEKISKNQPRLLAEKWAENLSDLISYH